MLGVLVCAYDPSIWVWGSVIDSKLCQTPKQDLVSERTTWHMVTVAPPCPVHPLSASLVCELSSKGPSPSFQGRALAMFSEFRKNHFICLLGPKESIAKVDSQQFSYSSGNHFTEAMFKWYLLVGPPRNSREERRSREWHVWTPRQYVWNSQWK